MKTREPHPHIVYWRNTSAEADAMAAALKNEKFAGDLEFVETSAQFLKALEHPQTQLVVTHHPELTGELVKNVKKNAPDAVLVVVCQDEKLIPAEVRDSITHLLNTEQLEQLAPLLRRALGRTSRLWSLKNSNAESQQCCDLLNALPDALIVCGLDEKIASWNASAEKLFGWSAAEALSKKTDELLPVLAGSPGRLEELKDAGDWSGEVTYQAKDGRGVQVLSRRHWIRSLGSDAGAMLEVCTPLSDVQNWAPKLNPEAELQAILRSRASLETRLQECVRQVVAGFDGLVLIDLERDDGVMTRVACAAKDPALAGLCAALKKELPIFSSNRHTAAVALKSDGLQVTGPLENPADFIGVTDPAQRAQLTSVHPRCSIAAPIQVLGRTAGLLTVCFLDEARPLDEAAKGNVAQLASMIGFAAECDALEKRLASQEVKPEPSSVNKDAFLGTLSHELRTPLQAMLGWTQMLRDKQLPPKFVEKALDSLELSIKAQSKIVNDLLDVSRINSGQLHLSVRATSLVPLLENALLAFQVPASIKHIELNLVANSETPLWIQADTIWLQRALWNILSNSIKFTPNGGKVQVEVIRGEDFAQVKFTDTGVGIEAPHLPKVFDYFSQADSGTTRVHGGLGVGMVISRFVIEAHGGTISADSKGLNEGTTFSLKLPLCNAPPPSSTHREAVTPEAEGADAPSLSGIRVLLVEDEADTRDMLQFVFTQTGAQVVEASSAKTAYTALLASAFDVMVSDIGLPNEDGYALIRKVRSLPPNLGGLIPALALTAYATKEDRAQALRAGFQGYAAKPVDVSELLLLVKSLVQKAALRDC